MATTVNAAFSEFIKETVNLNPDTVTKARDSRDNLLDNIAEFDDIDGFFDLCDSFNVHFGSFSRKTKCRELDDIDLMIGIAASGATYYQSDPWDNVRITAGFSNDAQIDCKRDDGTLNSTNVLNCFKKKLEYVREYSRSEIHRNGEAVTLNLKSKEWSFDIVPCFHTVQESNGRSYYLIPNGKGNWKKTDPKIDMDYVSNVNQKCEGNVLEVIRLVKYWNKRPTMASLPSYMLETMVLNCCETYGCEKWIDFAFRDVLNYISANISHIVQDPKGIQGNINKLTYAQMQSVSQRANSDYTKACEAIKYKTQDNNFQKSINMWGEIFGSNFPKYG